MVMVRSLVPPSFSKSGRQWSSFRSSNDVLPGAVTAQYKQTPVWHVKCGYEPDQQLWQGAMRDRLADRHIVAYIVAILVGGGCARA
jgi:hypothetical protein